MDDSQVILAIISGIVTIVSGFLTLNKLQSKRLDRVAKTLFDTLREELKSAKEDLKTAKAQAAEFESSLRIAQSKLVQVESLTAQVKVLTESLERVQKQVVELEHKNEELAKTLSSTQMEKQRLEEEIKGKVEIIAGLNTQIETYQKVFTLMGIEYSKLESKISS